MKNPAIVAALLLIASQAMAQNQVATLRGASDLAAEGPPPPIARTLNTDLRQVRNYPEQPPIIPHKIEAYQIDLNVNQCMTCHSRTAIEISLGLAGNKAQGMRKNTLQGESNAALYYFSGVFPKFLRTTMGK